MLKLAVLAIVAAVFIIPPAEAGLAVEARIDEVHNEKCLHLRVVLHLDPQQFVSRAFQDMTNSRIREIRPDLALRKCSDVERGFLLRSLRNALQEPADGLFATFWKYYSELWHLGGHLPVLTIEIDKPTPGKGDCLRIEKREGDFPSYEYPYRAFGDFVSLKSEELYRHGDRLYWSEKYLAGNLSAVKSKLLEKKEAGSWPRIELECQDVENNALRDRIRSLLHTAQRRRG